MFINTLKDNLDVNNFTFYLVVSQETVSVGCRASLGYRVNSKTPIATEMRPCKETFLESCITSELLSQQDTSPESPRIVNHTINLFTELRAICLSHFYLAEFLLDSCHLVVN